MGIMYRLRCPNCGEMFNWLEGGLKFYPVIYHCDYCGKESTVGRVFKHRNCKGYFRPDVKPICPKCHTKVDKDKNRFGLELMVD